jgi:hypothetical protein
LRGCHPCSNHPSAKVTDERLEASSHRHA